jgi:hypothetical protein
MRSLKIKSRSPLSVSVLANDWSGQPRLHGKASVKGWGGRRTGAKRYTKKVKKAHGLIPGINRFPIWRNPGLSLNPRPFVPMFKAKKRRSSRRRLSLNPMKFMRNPMKSAGGFAKTLKSLYSVDTFKEAGAISVGSVLQPIVANAITKALANIMKRDISTTGVVGMLMKAGSTVVLTTGAQMIFKKPAYSKAVLYGGVANIVDDLLKAWVFPRIPFLNTAMADYLTLPAGTSDYLTLPAGTSDYLPQGVADYFAPQNMGAVSLHEFDEPAGAGEY